MPKSISLDTSELRANLKKRSIHGGLYSFASQFGVYALRIACTAVMARVLVPGDYGVVSMVGAITNFADQFRTLGLAQSTIQKKNLTQEQLSAMFWINVAAGGGLTLIIAACAPLISWFYKEPALTGIALAASLSFLLNGANVQHTALLHRQMLLGRLAVVDITAVAGSSLVGIACALVGGKYWALVFMNVAHPLIRGVALWFATGWRPSLVLRRTGIRQMLKFGAGMSGFNIVNYFSRNMDNVLIGKYVGKEALGYYAKAYSLLLLPITQIRTPIVNTGIPALAALQDDPERYRRYYIAIVTAVAILSMPAVGWMMLCAEEIIRLMLGMRWLPSAEIFWVLGVVALTQPALTTARALPMLTTGQGGKYFCDGVINAIFSVTGFVIGLHWGAKGVAWGYVIATYAWLPLSVPWCIAGSSVKNKDVVYVFVKCSLVTLVAYVAAWLAKRAVSEGVAIQEMSANRAFVILLLTGFVVAFVTLLSSMLDRTSRKMMASLLNKFHSKGERCEKQSID